MNKRTRKLLGLMETEDRSKKEPSIKNRSENLVKPLPQQPKPVQKQNTGTTCSKCGEPCHYDFNKMVQVNDRNGKRHWCPFGDPPKPTKCRECGADMIFNQLYYDDFRCMFIPLNRDMTSHKCRNERRRKQSQQF